nr:tetratricopeptide repeat protein 9B-like [Oncorhynchus nerka]
MEAKQHSLKSLKSYPEAGGRSLAAAAGDVGVGGGGGGCRAGSAQMEMEANIQKAIDFKVEGHRCYKEKKFREAIGKYHRALLQLKGVHLVDGTTGSEVNLLSQAAVKLTEEQRRTVEITEIECYDSLTGEYWCDRLKVDSLCPRLFGPLSGPWREDTLACRRNGDGDTNVLRYIQLTEMKMSREGQRERESGKEALG